ncbi:hypothetical protein L7F22_029294 [Adiantum nelumboides]|nr:hypothetical protein [Adiantum nelumboides]
MTQKFVFSCDVIFDGEALLSTLASPPSPNFCHYDRDTPSSSSARPFIFDYNQVDNDHNYPFSHEEFPSHDLDPPLPAPAPQPLLVHSPGGSVSAIPTPAREFVFQASRPVATHTRRRLQNSSAIDTGITHISYPTKEPPLHVSDASISTQAVEELEPQSPRVQLFQSISEILHDSTPANALPAHLQPVHLKAQHGAVTSNSTSDSTLSEELPSFVDDTSIPLTEALALVEAPLWHDAMENEMRSLQQNETWKLVPRPPNRSIVSCRWILRKKYHANGTVLQHKARLVARGFSAKPGIDFQETFSPTLGLSTFQILMAIADKYNLEFHQMDVETAFLNGFLEEEIYMDQPPYFIDPEHPEYVCLLLAPYMDSNNLLVNGMLASISSHTE